MSDSPIHQGKQIQRPQWWTRHPRTLPVTALAHLYELAIADDVDPHVDLALHRLGDGRANDLVETGTSAPASLLYSASKDVIRTRETPGVGREDSERRCHGTSVSTSTKIAAGACDPVHRGNRSSRSPRIVRWISSRRGWETCDERGHYPDVRLAISAERLTLPASVRGIVGTSSNVLGTL